MVRDQSGVHVEVLQPGKPLGQFLTLQYRGKSPNGVSQYTNPCRVAGYHRHYAGIDYHYAGNAQPKLSMAGVILSGISAGT